MLICVALAFTLYWINLDDYFLADDFDLIVSFYGQPARYFPALLWSNESGTVWRDFGIDPERGQGYLRPLKIWLLKLDFGLWGTNPIGYHVTSTLLFAAVLHRALRVFWLLTGRMELAALGVGILAVHPVFARIVPFITAREELLAAFFVLASFGAVLAYRMRGTSSAKFSVFLGLGLMSKESAILALPLAVAWDAVHSNLRMAEPAGRRATLRLYIPAVLVVAIYMALRWVAFGNLTGGGGEPTEFGSVAALRTYHTDFIGSLLLSPEYLTAARSPRIRTLLVLIAGALVVLGLVRSPTRRFLRLMLFFGPVWYLISTSIYYGIPLAHRHHAVTIIGLTLFAVLVLQSLTQSFQWRWRVTAVALSMAVAVASFVPPTRKASENFNTASEVVESIRERIDLATQELPPGSRIRINQVPQATQPPYYFGWGLQSALKRPFTPSDLATRSVVFNEKNWLITRSRAEVPSEFDLVLNVGTTMK